MSLCEDPHCFSHYQTLEHLPWVSFCSTGISVHRKTHGAETDSSKYPFELTLYKHSTVDLDNPRHQHQPNLSAVSHTAVARANSAVLSTPIHQSSPLRYFTSSSTPPPLQPPSSLPLHLLQHLTTLDSTYKPSLRPSTFSHLHLWSNCTASHIYWAHRTTPSEGEWQRFIWQAETSFGCCVFVCVWGISVCV